MICDNLRINEAGHLSFAGVDTVEMAQKYGTPLYLMDEDKIRRNIRIYKEAFSKYFPAGSAPEYASKAFSCKRIYEVMSEEGMNIDVVSVGEMYTAIKAGFPMERCFFHGNNKTDSDIEFAVNNRVGCFVVDNLEELYAVNQVALSKGIVQDVIVRLTPGIDPHTHKKISTGSVDSKFGVAIETGQALEFVGKLLKCDGLRLEGFHCHIGSQIFESEPFLAASEIMLEFIRDVKDVYGVEVETLNLGGGFGVRYVESDPVIDIAEKIKEVADAVTAVSKRLGIATPKIMMEPGRSIVANAGMTLYSVGSVKEIKGYKTYVSIDGGMADNPRYTLYESPYTVINATRADMENEISATIAGRCCESGDLIKENAPLPQTVRGDIMAVLTTGAYNYSMASNYNRIARPPVVMLNDGKDYVAVKRETLDDLCSLDV